MALNIVLHTFRMIFGNFGQALRVSIGPYAILVLIVVAAFLIVGFPTLGEIDPMQPNIPPAAGLLPMLIIPLVLFVTAWVAVSWHRFILLEEYAGILPQISDRPIWSYAGKAILLGLLLFLVSIPIFFVLGAVAMPLVQTTQDGFTPTSLPLVPLLIFLAAAFFIGVLSLRWGVSLVGTALGKPMTFGDAWRATKPIGNVVIGVAIILVLINVVPSFVLNPLISAVPIVGALVELALTWLTMMLGISILTTLYGHVVEGRSLTP